MVLQNILEGKEYTLPQTDEEVSAFLQEIKEINNTRVLSESEISRFLTASMQMEPDIATFLGNALVFCGKFGTDNRITLLKAPEWIPFSRKFKSHIMAKDRQWWRQQFEKYGLIEG